MTTNELQDLIVTALVRTHGGTARGWRRVVGPVRVHDRTTHPHCNWSLAPAGDPYAVEVVETLLDRLRAERPLVGGG